MKRVVWILSVLLCCGSVAALVRAQDAPAEAEEAAPADPLAEFNQLREQWTEFTRELDKAQFRLNQIRENRGARARLQTAVQTYDELLEQGTDLLLRMMAASERAHEADPSNQEVRDLLQLLAETCLKSDRYEDAQRIALLLAEQSDSVEAYRQAFQASLQLLDLPTIDRCYERLQEADAVDEATQQGWDYLTSIRPEVEREMELRAQEASADDLPRVLLETSRGPVVIELFEDQAPNSVAHFLSLVAQGFYDELEFFRVETGFAAVTGCPNNNGTGGSGYEVLNEYDREDRRLPMHGTVSLADQHGQGRLGSQFFIALNTQAVQGSPAKNTVIGRVISGMDAIERLKRVDPETTEPQFVRDRIERALIVRRREHEYSPKTTFDIAKQKDDRAVELIEEGKFDEARLVLEEGLEVAPLYFALRFRLGLLLMQQEDLESAIVQLQRASRRAPQNSDVHYYLGVAYSQAGSNILALQHLERAASLNPEDANTQKNIGRLLLQQRRFNQAISHLEEAARLDPRDEETGRMLTRARLGVRGR